MRLRLGVFATGCCSRVAVAVESVVLGCDAGARVVLVSLADGGRR